MLPMNSKYRKITIGGISGTGKGTVGKLLAEKLGFKYMSVGNFVRKMIKEKGMDILEYNEEKNKDPEEAEKALDNRTKEYGEENQDFVFEGHIVAFFIEDSFKILLTCEDDERIKRISDRQNISFEDAKKETLEREKLQRENYKKVYGIENHVDPKHYDLVVDTTNILPPEIIQIIINEITPPPSSPL
jgi:CMP/dCMP kinase